MDIIIKGDMDGIETAETVRERFNIPVVYLTACADETILNRAKKTEPFGYIIKPYEDDELRLAIEIALYKHKMEEELRLSREQYRALLESSGAIPWELDTRGQVFTYLGPQARTVLGYPPEDLEKLEGFIVHIPKEHRARAKDFYLRAYKDSDSAEIEYPVISSTGDTIWLRDTATFTASVDGSRILRGFMRDITRRKLAEDQRELYIKDLQEALEKIKRLHGMLPICAWCKKIRDDQGYWKQVEVYFEEHSDAEFTHSICPDCKGKMEGELKELKFKSNPSKSNKDDQQ
jgi:PAS domain S-box-containing protein